MILIRVVDKVIRELYLFFHPRLWGKNFQLNGIPRIYDIKHLRVGKNVSINSGCVLQCYGGLEVGDNVTISAGAKILTRGLDIESYIQNANKSERDHIDKAVSIERGTWIATNAIILPGVHIATNCIIAAGAVVTKDALEKDSLYAGVPARQIRKLN